MKKAGQITSKMLKSVLWRRSNLNISSGVAALHRCRLSTSTRATSDAQPILQKSQTADTRFLERLGWLPWQLRVGDNAGVNRYRFVPAAILNHMCLGGVFAWSMFNEPITRLSGVLAPAAGDWLLSSTSALRHRRAFFFSSAQN